MAFVVDIFSPHDGSIDLLLLSELFEPTADEGQEGIVGLSVSVILLLLTFYSSFIHSYAHHANTHKKKGCTAVCMRVHPRTSCSTSMEGCFVSPIIIG